jgi:protein ImuB
LARTSISPRRFVPPFIAERRFAEPIGHEDDVHRSILTLAADLARMLEKQGLGGRRFELTFFRADGATRRMGIETARPLREPKTVMRLFRDRLDTLADPLDPGFGFDLIRLTAPVTEMADAHEPDFDGANDLKDDLAALVDRLGIRLHPTRVTRLAAENTHQPERASLFIPAQSGNAAIASAWEDWHEPESASFRPIRLFDPPEPIDVIADVPDGPPVRFRWRRVFHVVIKAEGPERIAPEWWRMMGETMPATRDYYRVENEHGARFWIFRAGLYGADATLPRWFMHGVFG